jgi:hypothetical protein
VRRLEVVSPPTIARCGTIYKAKAIEFKDRKRKDVKSSAGKENFWQKFPEGLQILKKMVE